MRKSELFSTILQISAFEIPVFGTEKEIASQHHPCTPRYLCRVEHPRVSPQCEHAIQVFDLEQGGQNFFGEAVVIMPGSFRYSLEKLSVGGKKIPAQDFLEIGDMRNR